jgi:PIN domain nuclease of toxin-antitoxin system
MRPPFLLDTNVCIWLIDGELPLNKVAMLTAAYNDGLTSYVSPITALEVATLARKRRLKSQLSPQRWFERLLGLPGIALAPMPAELLIASQLLPGDIHKDPADRIIAATAREYGYTVMTRDRALLDYGRQGYLSVFEC